MATPINLTTDTGITTASSLSPTIILNPAAVSKIPQLVIPNITVGRRRIHIWNGYMWSFLESDDSGGKRARSLHRINLSAPVAWETVIAAPSPGSFSLSGASVFSENHLVSLNGWNSPSGSDFKPSYYCNLNDIAPVWSDVSISDWDTTQCGGDGGTNNLLQYASMVAHGGKLWVQAGILPADYYTKNSLKYLDLAALTSGWKCAGGAPWWGFCYQSFGYNGKLYFCGGVKSLSSVGGWPPINATVFSYDIASGIFAYPALPDVPSTSYWECGCLVRNRYYYIFSGTSVYHYIDLQSSSPVWKPAIFYPINNSYALAYDEQRNILYSMDPSGYVYALHCTDTGSPAVTGWNVGYQYGVVNPIVSAANLALHFDLTHKDRYSVGSGAIGLNLSFAAPLGRKWGQKFTTPSEYFSIVQDVSELNLSGNSIKCSISFAPSGSGITGVVASGSLYLSFTSLASEMGVSAAGALVLSFGSSAAGKIDITGVSRRSTFGLYITSRAAGVVGRVGSGHGTLFFAIGNTVEDLVGVGASIFSFSGVSTGGENPQGSASSRLGFEPLAYGHVSEIWVSPDSTQEDSPTAWVVNLVSEGHAWYTGYLFSAFFRIGNTYYGGNPDGLFALEGETDDTVDIPAVITTGVSDFGVPNKKFTPELFLHTRQQGTLEVRASTDEANLQQGLYVEYDEQAGIHRRRRKLSRAVKGTNWQFEIRNVRGSNFVLKQLEVHPEKSSRTAA